MVNAVLPLCRLLNEFADILLDDACAACGNLRQGSESQSCYCLRCEQQLTPIPRHRCHRCSAECGPWSAIDRDCVHCRGRRLRFSSTVSLGTYAGLLRREILAAKWSWSSARIQCLGQLLAAHSHDSISEWNPTLIVPIPQHWRKRLARHFNPAERIAAELARRHRIRLDLHLLSRSRASRPQKRVAMTKRFENQQNSFQLRASEDVRGQRILLVDDVLTTGATCAAAAQILLGAGAQDCNVAVLGRVTDGTG